MGPPPPPFRNEKEHKFKLPDDRRQIIPFLLKTAVYMMKRLFYIFKLVWNAKPWILFVMMGYPLGKRIYAPCRG